MSYLRVCNSTNWLNCSWVEVDAFMQQYSPQDSGTMSFADANEFLLQLYLVILGAFVFRMMGKAIITS